MKIDDFQKMSKSGELPKLKMTVLDRYLELCERTRYGKVARPCFLAIGNTMGDCGNSKTGLNQDFLYFDQKVPFFSTFLTISLDS